MTTRVEIRGLVDEEDTLFGYILSVDGELSAVPELPMLEEILEEPIFVDGEDLYSTDDPEKFMESLHLHYKSAGMWASMVQELIK